VDDRDDQRDADRCAQLADLTVGKAMRDASFEEEYLAWRVQLDNAEVVAEWTRPTSSD
jgi:hypothetical protein